MRIAIDPTSMLSVLLMACRIGPLFMLTPILGSNQTPTRIKLLLSFALAALMVMGPRTDAQVDGSSLASVLSAAMVEVGIGMAFAFGVQALFAAFTFGGRLLDMQIGFGVAGLLDPVTRGHGPLLGTGLNLLAMAVFFALDGHHLILRGLAYSVEVLPPGGSLAKVELSALLAQFGLIVSYGLVIVAPTVVALLLLDVAFALVSRTMPQMNVFVVAMPLKVVVGLMMLAFSMNHLLPVMRRLFEAMPAHWHRLLPS